MKFKNISFIVLVVLLISGCAKEQLSVTVEGDDNLVPIGISGAIVQEATKATADGFVDGDALGLFAVNYLENNTIAGILQSEGNQADNVKYVFDEKNHKWFPVKVAYYKNVNTHADLYLYYPYLSSINDVNSEGFEVKKDQSAPATSTSLSGYEASDFLWGKGTDITPSQTAVSIRLSHKMSAVKVALSKGEGFEEGEFEGLEKNIILTGTTRKANINYATGEVSPLGEAQMDGIVMCPQSDGSWRAIAVPQTIAPGVQLFSITVGGISYSFKQSEATEYLSGKQTDFTITVKKKAHTGEYEFVLADARITDWTEDENTHGGEARQYFVVNVSEPGTLGSTIKSMGKNPDKIRNLKVVGTVRDDDFYFMRDSMAILEAVNMKESTVVKPKNSTNILASLNDEKGYRFELNYKIKCSIYGEPDIIEDYGSRFNIIWYDKGNNIPYRAFENKETLYDFSFPENINIIGESAFANSGISGTLIIPDGVLSVESKSFSETSIGRVIFSHDLLFVGEYAFSGCSSLSGALTLPPQLLSIGKDAFYHCNFTGELHLPDNLEYLGNGAFRMSGHFVGGLRIPDKITKLYGRTFEMGGGYGISFTGTLDLNNLTELGEHDFNSCNFTGELVIPEGVTSIPVNCFCGDGAGITSVKFPTTLIEIQNGAFLFQQTLSGDIVFPEGFQIVGNQAFCSSGITGIELPSTIQVIGGEAFMNCSSLSSIVCNAIEPPTASDGAFSFVAKDNFTVEVPAHSIQKYLSDPIWGEFKRIAAHYDFSLSREKIRSLNAGITRTYTLRAPANFNWNIDSKPDWVSVSPESGIGKSDVTITVNEMARTSDQFEINEGTYNNPIYKNYRGRSGEIVFKLNEKDYTFTMEVEQFDCDYADGDVITHQTATKGNGIDIIFVGDGYDAKDIANGIFTDNAEEGYEDYFNIEPYKTYKEYFNVYSVVSMSDDSGIGTENTVIETKFGTYFSQGSISNPDFEPIFAWAMKANSLIDSNKAVIINLMNTPSFASFAAMYGDGSAIAFCPVSRDVYPYDFRGVIQHTAGGHAFGKLGDEYIYHNAFIQNCGCDCCDHPKGDDDTWSSYGSFKSLGWYKNLSMNGDMHQVPWAHLIYHPQYSGYVDLFEGGYMHSRGMYRSEATSCMNNNIPYYSAISRQAIVERIMEIAGEEFTLEKFYANDSNAFGEHTKSSNGTSADRTFGVDPNWSRGSEEGSVIYMGEHPDYDKIKELSK